MRMIPWKIRRLGRRIAKFWAWFPIIWRDEDWDSAYLFEIMRFKIARIRKELETNCRHIGVEKQIQHMKVVEELLNRHGFSDFYHDNRFDYDHQGLCTCKGKTIDESCFEKIDSEIEAYSWKSPFCRWCNNRIIIKRGVQKKEDDFAVLCELMRKHSRRWWD